MNNAFAAQPQASPPVAAYRNFDLEISRAGGRIVVRVLRSPEGEDDATTAAFAALPAPLDETDTLGGMDAEIGRRLLPDAVGERWAASLATAEQAGEGLRLRLFLNDPDLASVAWEAAQVRGKWLALRPQTPMVRYVPAARAPGTVQVTGPLRLLVLLGPSAAIGLPALDESAERATLEGALAPLQEAGRVQITWLPGATTRGDLLDALRRVQPHLLHFVGHGAYDEVRGHGSLILSKAGVDGKPAPDAVETAELGVMLDGSSVRLAVLNACQTGRAAGGVAQALVKAALPAAVGMQASVPDDAAVAFCGAFYRAVADGWPVDAAVVEGRRLLAAQVGMDAPWWALPTLYMRAPDGILWRTQSKEEPAMSQEPGKPWWDQLPASPPQAGGDVIIAHIGAGARGVAVGKQITQTIYDALGPPTPDDRQVIEAKLAAVMAALHAARASLDPATAAIAEFQIKLLQGEMVKTGEGETPSASTITQVGDWLLANVPPAASVLSALFATPAAGKIMGKAGESAVAWARQRFADSR